MALEVGSGVLSMIASTGQALASDLNGSEVPYIGQSIACRDTSSFNR